ncbi:cupin domain-containing protein [Azospirillum sp. YIM B02556]|uniref:Cupin domain-containing protein n=2 Tax=Azospirillum endophyticum TaxID=2800326 RepID=A0ABS1F1W1_9PROT|nr:cupin domain-containing protein [Azospirillum endophyticum]
MSLLPAPHSPRPTAGAAARTARLRRTAIATGLLAAGGLGLPVIAPAVALAQPAQKEAAVHQPTADLHPIAGETASQAPRSVVLLETPLHSDGKPIAYPKGAPQILVRTTEIPVGARTGVHSHPVPLVTYILNGVLTIQSATGETKTYKPGDAFVERTDWHEGINQGLEPVRLLAVYVGEVGAPLSIKPSN